MYSTAIGSSHIIISSIDGATTHKLKGKTYSTIQNMYTTFLSAVIDPRTFILNFLFMCPIQSTIP